MPRKCKLAANSETKERLKSYIWLARTARRQIEAAHASTAHAMRGGGREEKRARMGLERDGRGPLSYELLTRPLLPAPL